MPLLLFHCLLITVSACTGVKAPSTSLPAANASSSLNVDFKEIRRLPVDGCRFERLAINHMNPRQLMIADHKGRLQSIDLQLNEATWTDQLPNDSQTTSQVETIHFGTNGDALVIAGLDLLQIRDANSGAVRLNFLDDRSTSVRKNVRYLAAAFSKDQRWVVTASQKDEFQAFDLSKVSSLGSDYDAAIKARPILLQVWDAQSGRLVSEMATEDSFLREVGFSDDGQFVFSASFTNLRFFDAQRLGNARSITATETGASYPIFIASAVTQDLRFVAVKTLGPILLISTESRRVVSRISSGVEQELSGVQQIEFSKQGTQLELTDGDGMYYSLALPGGAYVRSGHSSGVGRQSLGAPHYQPMVAFDPFAEFAVETTPPKTGFTVRGERVGDTSKCQGLRVISLGSTSGG